MGIKTNVTLQIVAQLFGAGNLGSATQQVNIESIHQLGSGHGAGLGDTMFSDARTLASGANESLDLNGSLVNELGQTIDFARVKGLYIKAHDANTTDLTVGAGANPFIGVLNVAGTVLLKPGAMFLYSCPGAVAAPVTPTTGDILKVSNASGAAATYDIVVFGDSM
jgi:hypothetical protein